MESISCGNGGQFLVSHGTMPDHSGTPVFPFTEHLISWLSQNRKLSYVFAFSSSWTADAGPLSIRTSLGTRYRPNPTQKRLYALTYASGCGYHSGFQSVSMFNASSCASSIGGHVAAKRRT